MSTARVNNITRASGSGIPDLGGVAGNRLTPSSWVNFNGTGTIAIRDSQGVASLTDLGIGQYQVNFPTPMANSNFCAVAQASINNGSDNGAYMCKLGIVTTTSYSIVTQQSNANTYIDALIVCGVTFGGKA